MELDPVEEYEERTGIHLDAHNRETLRKMVTREDEFWALYAANEERPTNNNQLDYE